MAEVSPPLGLLELASVARAEDAEVSVVDFNLLYHLDPRLRDWDFYATATELLLREQADVYGFTSMAVDSHVALELARLVKQAEPSCVTVFGGSHFSSSACEFLGCYPWVDYIARGEGESAFASLVRCLASGAVALCKDIPGLWSQSSTADKGASTVSPPPPAFDLVNIDAYFRLNPRRTLDFEASRGCRFKCAFCYSPLHYTEAHSFQIDETLCRLASLKRLGADHVFFVDDNFLNWPAFAVQFCRELDMARLGLQWTCYATFPQLNTNTILWMRRAGCAAVFSGIDAVGETSQCIFNKRFASNLGSMRCRIEQCVELGIVPTCAFLLSPPSHPCGADVNAVIGAALVAREAGAQVRLNTFTPYTGTPSQRGLPGRTEFDELKVRLLLDVPECVETNAYARSHPELFPFHARYVPKEEWTSFIGLSHCLFTLLHAHSVDLLQMWKLYGMSPVDFAEQILKEMQDIMLVPKERRREEELELASQLFGNVICGDSVSLPSEAGRTL